MSSKNNMKVPGGDTGLGQALQEGTAAEAEQALRALDIDHLSTGHHPGFGYTDVYRGHGPTRSSLRR
ncbi:hypothetical protein ACWDWU_11765 [Streptomyces sp. NPDC003442]